LKKSLEKDVARADKLSKNMGLALDKARQAGKMLAICLALGFPFLSQTVSLVGYSLGCQVIKSCLKTLHRIGAHEIIHNVTFLGGATNFHRDKEMWETIFCQTVAGKLKNVYSTKDFILGVYQAAEKHDAIGRHQQFATSL